MAIITPFVKRMRTQGGTIYTFSSALEDIGLNINERNNIVKMSHYALLNIPSIDAPDNLDENRFNVLAITGAFKSFGTNIKDGRIIVAESFQNYALNLETNILSQPTYNPALSLTISERVFWKWLKETGAIRWTRIDTSSGIYWQEEYPLDNSVGYSSVVKCIGQISAGSVRTDTFGTYNETYVLVPTSFGQTPVYFKQVEDDNYYHGLSITGGLTNILGRNPYTKPHPDGLDIKAYYDLPDSSTVLTTAGAVSYTMQYDNSTGGWYNGWWWTGENLQISNENSYFVDTSNYINSRIYNTNLYYYNGPYNYIMFKRSNVDCLSIEYDLDNLKTIFGDSTLTFDKLAIQDSIDDNFDFNAILIYYSVYNKALDKILATNLLGVLFLDPPSGNTASYPSNEILLPSIEKLQSGDSGFGTSYSFRLNIKSDYMLDDSQAIVTDTTASQIVLSDFSDVFDNLSKTLAILNQQTGTINYITEQYLDLTSQQTNLLNQVNGIQNQLNTITRDIAGTENTIAMFTEGDDPIGDSSIYQKNGNVGILTNNPKWGLEVDSSVKVMDLIIENAIRDTNGNILLGYGSPLQFGSSTNYRNIQLYTGGAQPAFSIDSSNLVTIGTLTVDGSFNNADTNKKLNNYVPNASLSTNFQWSTGLLYVNVSMGGSGSSAYIDSSLLARDISINWLATHTSAGGVTQPYVDSSLLARDISINWLIANKANLLSPALSGTPTAATATLGTNNTQLATTQFAWSAVHNYVDGSLYARDVSILYIQNNAAFLNVAPIFTANVTIKTASEPQLLVSADGMNGLFLSAYSTNVHYNWLISEQNHIDGGLEITPSTTTGGTTFTTPALRILQSGAIAAPGEITAYYVSDKELKSNLKSFDALDIIEQIKPVSFNWNDKAKKLNNSKDDRLNYGIIAQELEEILPELIHPVYGEYKAIDYIQLVSICIQGIKELKKEIDDLKLKL
jgi:Chaperone of endosialidase